MSCRVSRPPGLLSSESTANSYCCCEFHHEYLDCCCRQYDVQPVNAFADIVLNGYYANALPVLCAHTTTRIQNQSLHLQTQYWMVTTLIFYLCSTHSFSCFVIRASHRILQGRLGPSGASIAGSKIQSSRVDGPAAARCICRFLKVCIKFCLRHCAFGHFSMPLYMSIRPLYS